MHHALMQLMASTAAVGGGGGPAFSGLLLTASADGTATTSTSEQQLTLGSGNFFNTVVYDAGGWLSGSTLTVPSGVTLISVALALAWDTSTAQLKGIVKKNGTEVVRIGSPRFQASGGFTTYYFYKRWTIQVTAGDVLTFFWQSATGTNSKMVTELGTYLNVVVLQ